MRGWRTSERMENKLKGFERCLRIILKIGWEDRITNKEVATLGYRMREVGGIRAVGGKMLTVKCL